MSIFEQYITCLFFRKLSDEPNEKEENVNGTYQADKETKFDWVFFQTAGL